MHHAAARGHIGVVEWLLDANADLANQRDDSGRSPGDVASFDLAEYVRDREERRRELRESQARNRRDSQALIKAIEKQDHVSYRALTANYPRHPRPDQCGAVLKLSSVSDLDEHLAPGGVLYIINASGALGEGGMCVSGWSDPACYLGYGGRIIGSYERHGYYDGPAMATILIYFEKVGLDWKLITDEIMSWFPAAR
jgi:hypothetical protein